MNNRTPFTWKAILFVFICFAFNLNAQFTETSFAEGPVYKKKIAKTFFQISSVRMLMASMRFAWIRSTRRINPMLQEASIEMLSIIEDR